MLNFQPQQSFTKSDKVAVVQGFSLVGILAYLCIHLSEVGLFKSLGLGTLTLAIVLGIILGNSVYPRISTAVDRGVFFAKSYLLKLGIVLYGFHLTFSKISQVGVTSIMADAVMVCSTFGISYFLGRKIFQLDPQTCILIGAGNSICGAAAILATEPVVKAGTDKVAVAVAVVVIFGTLPLFLYPLMYHYNFWQLTDKQWGLYIGSSVHEVAQVYATGAAINSAVADMAVTTKMIRVMMLAPFLVAISLWLNRRAQGYTNGVQPLNMPWFALAFMGVVGFNSLDWLPRAILKAVLEFDNMLLAMAMVALGLTTHISAIQRAGSKPIILGAVMLLWLVFAGGILQLALANP